MAILEKKVNQYCPFCDLEHELEVHKRRTTSIIDGVEVEHDETYYFCSIEEDIFTPAKIVDQNLLNARDEYRTITNRLTSSEIREVREMYNVNQKEFSHLLGWGDVTIQRYEKKTIQDETYDQKMKEVKENPFLARRELERNRQKYSNVRYNEIKELMNKLIKNKGIAYLKSQVLEARYVEYIEPSNLNGNQYLKINKKISTMTYLAQYSNTMDQMKLFSLLWMIDIEAFKRSQHSITGLVYKKRHIGVLPIGYLELLSLAEDVIEIIDEFANGNIISKLNNKKNVNLSEFEPIEIEIFQTILRKFDDMGSIEINDFLQHKLAKLDIKENENVPF